MAEVRPIYAVHYDPERVEIADVTAPPYDVIDDAGRAELLGRSDHNVVELDLPRTDDGSNIYAHAAELFGQWRADGTLVADEEPTIWAYEQDYTDPDGNARTRRGFLARVGVTDYGPGLVRPHERTQPGPKLDRLELTRATEHNLSPIFVLHPGDAWSLIAPAIDGAEPFCEVTDPDGTVHRAWPVADTELHEGLAELLDGAELLIADGHHRYSVSRTYRDMVRKATKRTDTAAELTLTFINELVDDQLSIEAIHRIYDGLSFDELKNALSGSFTIEPMTEPLSPATLAQMVETERLVLLDPKGEPYRLRLKSGQPLAEALPEASEAYRTLDAAALESLILSPAGDDERRHRREARPLVLLRLRGDAATRRGGRGRRRLLPPPDAGRAGPSRR